MASLFSRTGATCAWTNSSRVDELVARPQAVDAARSHARSTPSTQRVRMSSRPVWWGRAARRRGRRPLRLRHAAAGRRRRGEAGEIGGGVDVLARAPAAEVFLEGDERGRALDLRAPHASGVEAKLRRDAGPRPRRRRARPRAGICCGGASPRKEVRGRAFVDPGRALRVSPMILFYVTHSSRRRPCSNDPPREAFDVTG